MMSESVTVTVQDGSRPAGAKPGDPGHQGSGFALSLNPLYFRSIPGILKIAQLEDEAEEQPSEQLLGSSEAKEEENQPTEEEIELQRKRLDHWQKLTEFLNGVSGRMIDAVSLNATTNLHTNDVANLQGKATLRGPVFADSPEDYEETVSLVDLASVEDRHLMSASWHCSLENVIVCAYLDAEAARPSLLALWSLDSPLRPRVLLKCEEKLTVVSFCPLTDFTNIIVGGCVDGKLVVWEINERMLIGGDEPDRRAPLTEATIAASGEKAQSRSITTLQWLPAWCRLEPDGNFQLVASGNSRKAHFATSSIDGSLFFWSLPSTLSNPAELRSPLNLTISPIYQLVVQDPAEKSPTRIPITCFSLPLAKNEESSSLNIRDQADLDRLRRVFLGSARGEVLCCSWESQTFAVDVTDREVCKLISRSCVHDGIVRTMAKSPHLDDVFLTVGCRVFALWKEDMTEAPIFRWRSPGYRYGGGCWTGRSGLFAIARLDGCFELWDLKRSSEEPILRQTVSGKLSASIYPNPASIARNLLAVQDGPSTLRVFQEAQEAAVDEDLERLEWLEEFAWRETKRKRDFGRWQDEYLRQHPTALQRKLEREQAEAARRHREAREKFVKLLGIICMATGSPGVTGGGHWFLFVAVTAFIVTLAWCFIYLLSIRENLKLPVNWILTEFINYATYTVLYFTAFVAELAAHWAAHYLVAGVFGLINTLVYAASTYFLYLEWKNSQQ